MTGLRRSVFLLIAFASCSSNTSAPSDLSPAVKAKWDAYCASRGACLSGSTCASSACMARVTEEEALIEFVDCQNAKACGANDDECVASSGTTDAEREAFRARCTAVIGTVQNSTTCYANTSLCTLVAYPLIRKQYMRAVEACLTVACPDRVDCLAAAVEPLNCF